MTVTTGGPDVAPVVRAMSEANVQFVVVGEPTAGSPLQLVVSRHPTNLDALGRALDRLESSVRATEPASGGTRGRDAAPRRIGDPLGTISVTTSAGDVDLMFGGPRRSLYTELSSRAEEREVGGLRVQWTPALPELGPLPRATGRVVARRLLSIAEGLAHLVDRRDGESGASDGSDGWKGTAGNADEVEGGPGT